MIAIYKFTGNEEIYGDRIDSAISARVEALSRSAAQKLIEAEKVKINGTICASKKIRVRQGDLIEAEAEERAETRILPENIPLEIVYEDEDVIVVNKPRGMTVHPADRIVSGTLVNALLYHCGDRLSDVNGKFRPGIVHRIDKDTSGLIMAAKNNEAHSSLEKQLFLHTVTRRYQALVRDNIKEETGTVDMPVGRDPKNRIRRAVNGIGSKRAVTHYRVIERFGTATLIECVLETGRTHQIRVHMSFINHPLLEDPLYGPRKERTKAIGQMLHAAVLGFTHPSTGRYMEFEIEPPVIFMERLEKLRKTARNPV